MAVRKITIECRCSVSGNVHQYFPCLKSIKDTAPVCCKFVLEYSEEIPLPDSFNTIQEEFNKTFECYLSQGRDLLNRADNNTERSSDISQPAQIQSGTTEAEEEKLRFALDHLYTC